MKRMPTGGVGTLQVTIQARPDGKTYVAFTGAIDENSDFQQVFDRVSGDAVFNMRGVDRVNSMGVHGWVPHVKKFSAQHQLVIEDISYPLVQNANSVARLFGSAQIQSCMAPYYCAACRDNTTVSVAWDEVVPEMKPPTKQCARCNSPLEFDELDGYFDFFRSRTEK